MEYPSKLLEEAVLQIAQLPGIGRKTALRLALHLLRADASKTETLSAALLKMRNDVQYCLTCHNLADAEQCQICRSRSRDHSLICVVEGITDLMALENTAQYQGCYHVLGGVISPMDGVGPEDLHIDSLVSRSREAAVREVIFALNSSLEADTTTFYITKMLRRDGLKLTSIARGVPIGSELEYTDEITLARSLAARTDYH